MIRWLQAHATSLCLIFLLLLGAYLRLYKISEYMTFLGDEGRDMLVIKHMLIDHKFTLLGPTASVGGFFLGPIYYYFMLPFVWAWQMDPTGAAVMVALAGIATIYLIYRVGRDFFDEWVGLIAASIYTVSPVVIAYSRSSWNPNLVPLFSTLLMYLLWLVIVKKHPKLLFWIGVILGIGLQLHYLFLFLFPIVVIWFVLFGREKKMLPFYGLGIAGFLIGYGPFLAFELRHGFPNTISIIRFLKTGQDTGFVFATFLATITDVSYRLFGRLLLRLPQPEVMVNVPTQFKLLWEVAIKFLQWSSLALIVAYVARFVTFPFKVSASKSKHDSWFSSILLLLWFIIPILLFGLYKKGIYDYYFGLFFAVPFLLIGLLLRAMSVRMIGKVIAVLALSYILFYNWQGRPFVTPPNNQLGQAKLIARAALDKAEGKPFNFALLANFNSDHAYRYFFEIWGSKPVVIEREEIDPKRTTVMDQLIIICELPECKPLGHPLWEIAGFGRAEVTGEWPVSFVRVQRLVHYQGK
jgi:4-amino-4-deoxy-L-arabinose transferase-like glycosyltransferase